MNPSCIGEKCNMNLSPDPTVMQKCGDQAEYKVESSLGPDPSGIYAMSAYLCPLHYNRVMGIARKGLKE